MVGCFKTLCFDPTWDEDKYVEVIWDTVGGLTPNLCHACHTSGWHIPVTHSCSQLLILIYVTHVISKCELVTYFPITAIWWFDHIYIYIYCIFICMIRMEFPFPPRLHNIFIYGLVWKQGPQNLMLNHQVPQTKWSIGGCSPHFQTSSS